MTIKKIKSVAKPPAIPVADDPRQELRRLVKQHRTMTRTAVALDHMASDRKRRTKTGEEMGDTIQCLLPDDRREALKAEAQHQRDAASRLETAMKRELRRLPVYQVFLSKLFPSGAVVPAYLASEIDINICIKPSALRRFCGVAVIDGRLERRKRGEKNHYNSELRTRLFQMMTFWRMNRRHGPNKYVQIWDDYKHRSSHMAIPEKPIKAERKGLWKAVDVFLHDLYVIWRACEGLPVWPTYTAAKLGYGHGGLPVENVPVFYTIEQATSVVFGEPLADAAQ